MKFGPVPVAEAEGAVLAHSVELTKGRLRKGKLLGAADVAALAEAGHEAVIVARLDPGDVGEDAAALRLARALVPEAQAVGLRIAEPFTGRVNVFATGPGVLRLDAGRIDAVNAVDPMITVATLPRMAQVVDGAMVATIKIISYGVDGAALERACDAAETGALTRAAPVHRTASLIVTEIPGGAGEKGAAAIAARVEALGMGMEGQVVVPHRTEALAEAIAAARGDLVLILTGSATSDGDDVAPSAMRAGGGRIERFGMPVDPGNLLVLGARADGVPVIGLPGCARSPALNGADWVLARVACGIGVTGADISAMGVGGLLKEVAARGMPRKGRG